MNHEQNSFTVLVEKAMQQQGRAHMRPVNEAFSQNLKIEK